jgi:hypothetical protein
MRAARRGQAALFTVSGAIAPETAAATMSYEGVRGPGPGVTAVLQEFSSTRRDRVGAACPRMMLLDLIVFTLRNYFGYGK